MIDALALLDRYAALGVVARAALALEEPGNPASEAILDDEISLREKILAEARKSIGVSPDDESAEALERLGDFLDKEAEVLVGPSDTEAALHRLAEAGDLPSDMYEVSVDPGIANWLGSRYDLERALIGATIRLPDRQQHYARSKDPTTPSLVSLFFRRFRTKWPFKDFGMLVVGSRNGLILNVTQAWRIFPSLFDVQAANSLVDMLEMFTKKYGPKKMTWAGKTGSFFLTVDEPLPPRRTYTLSELGHGEHHILLSSIVQHQDGRATAALVTAIDIMKYDRDLQRMAVSASEIKDDLKIVPLRAS